MKYWFFEDEIVDQIMELHPPIRNKTKKMTTTIPPTKYVGYCWKSCMNDPTCSAYASNSFLVVTVISTGDVPVRTDRRGSDLLLRDFP